MARTRSDELEANIVRGARAVLIEAGAGAFTQRAVAQRAEVSLQSIYNRFASKHDLLDEVAHQGFVELRHALLDEGGVPLGDIDDPIDNIVEGLERYRRFAVGQPEIYGLMFDVQTGGFRISDRTLGTAFEALGVLIGAVDAAIAAGRIRADVDSLAAAQQIWAAAHGALRFELTEVGFVDDWHRHYTDIIHTMLRGLRPEVDAEPDTDGHPDTGEPRGA